MTDADWFLGIAAFFMIGAAIFAHFERRGRVEGPIHTLSRAVWDLFEAFPLAIIIGVFNLGGFIYGLLVHFFWHWCPPGVIGVG